MGCDIHAHIEIKIKGEWHYYAPCELHRNYRAFSYIAGVRHNPGYPQPIAMPRGLPKDASFMVKFRSEYYGADGHSHSWLSCDEIAKVIHHLDVAPSTSSNSGWGKWPTFNVWLFGNDIMDWRDYPKHYPSLLEDIRLVFWFDN